MPHDDERFVHRIGGEISPHRIPLRALPAGTTVTQPDRARRVLVACAVAVTVGVAGIMALILPAGGDPPDPVAQQITYPSPWEFEPSAPVSVLPSPSSSSPPTPAPVATTRRPAPTRISHRTVTPAPVVDLNVGATVGLQVAGRSGVRLRHHDFIGRVDHFGASVSALDRADSRFVVRKGLGRDGCVSLESVNYPGYFLRHRDFVLHLDRRDRSHLFAQDATFCTSPTRDGDAFILESINYPSRALSVHDDGVLHLDENGATAFVVRPPL
jgi:hypothetical protein